MLSENSPTNFQTLSKSEKYAYVHTAARGLCESENDLTANLANISALLKEVFNWWWVGFYLVKQDELVLGPFQGPVACTRIQFGKGVCGTAWQLNQTQLVPDVHQFPGHIACSAISNSEIVVPIAANNQVVAVLDADSEHFAHFTEDDARELEILCQLLSSIWH